MEPTWRCIRVSLAGYLAGLDARCLVLLAAALWSTRRRPTNVCLNPSPRITHTRTFIERLLRVVVWSGLHFGLCGRCHLLQLVDYLVPIIHFGAPPPPYPLHTRLKLLQGSASELELSRTLVH